MAHEGETPRQMRARLKREQIAAGLHPPGTLNTGGTNGVVTGIQRISDPEAPGSTLNNRVTVHFSGTMSGASGPRGYDGHQRDNPDFSKDETYTDLEPDVFGAFEEAKERDNEVDVTCVLPGDVLAVEGHRPIPATPRNPDGFRNQDESRDADRDAGRNPDTFLRNSGQPSQDGSRNPDGSLRNPDGSVRNPDGTLRYQDGSYRTPDGVLRNADGSLRQ